MYEYFSIHSKSLLGDVLEFTKISLQRSKSVYKASLLLENLKGFWSAEYQLDDLRNLEFSPNVSSLVH